MNGLVLPKDRGGWWHDYVCGVHGVELEHDGLLTGSFPCTGARCRYGCTLDTAAIRGAWAALAHQACARELVRLAEAGTDDELVLRSLRSYAEQYAELGGDSQDAQPWMLRGRMFHQALSEAIWAVNLGRAARVLEGRQVELGAVTSFLTELADAALAARRLLLAEGRFTSNYVAWLNAAGAVCSGEMHWLDGPDGLYEHILAVTAEDGWQWEGSTYYHVFVLHAAVLAIRATPGAVPPPEVRDRLEAMYRVLETLRTTGGLLPALHDGPYARPDYTAELADLAGPLEPEPMPAWTGVRVFPSVGYAVLRGHGIQAVVDFGPHGGSHGHRDKLALYLHGSTTAWQPDPGQVPYGHTRWRDYYASTAAHPTYSIDQSEQLECTGRLVHSDDHSVTVACDNAYGEGVQATRRVTITEDGLLDELTVRCDRPRMITAQLRPGGEIEVRGSELVHTVWAGAEVLTGVHECDVPAFFVVRRAPGPADDPQRSAQHVDWTAHGTSAATFRSAYRLEDS